MTRRHRGFTHVRPPDLPLTCCSRMERNLLGLNPGLRTPRLPMTHAAGGDRSSSTDLGLHHRHQPTSLGNPLNPCDLVSHERVHSIPRLPRGTPPHRLHHQRESINFQLRKITKTRGHFPSDEAAMKLPYLGLRNISSKRGGEYCKIT
jgi:hypothetical protein